MAPQTIQSAIIAWTSLQILLLVSGPSTSAGEEPRLLKLLRSWDNCKVYESTNVSGYSRFSSRCRKCHDGYMRESKGQCVRLGDFRKQAPAVKSLG